MTFHKKTEEEFEDIINNKWIATYQEGFCDPEDIIKDFISQNFIDKRIVEEEIRKHHKTNTYGDTEALVFHTTLNEIHDKLLKDNQHKK